MSEHIIRQQHFVAGVETERERILAIIDRHFDCISREVSTPNYHVIPLCPGCLIIRDIETNDD